MSESTQDEQAVLIYLDRQNLPDEIYEEYDVLTLDEQLTNVLEEQEQENTTARNMVLRKEPFSGGLPVLS